MALAHVSYRMPRVLTIALLCNPPQVSTWTYGPCDRTKGVRVATRTVLVQPSGSGTACPSLNEVSSCPRDCQLTAW
jgi:hypothetical protein